jgi:REP element-mobilizing transposase RayT
MELCWGMARQRRFQYPGAVYHIMARGDGGKTVFETDDDRLVFLSRLGEVCASCGWRVHAWVLMGNHFHLLLETPQPNLVAGMKWLLGTFSQGWNRARLRQGHVFQGRYKSVPVNSSDADRYYFRIVADYIHLNPARAGLAGGRSGSLAGYRWSSLPAYAGGKVPPWLEIDRVLNSFELAKDGRGRRAYVAWLEARAANEGGNIDSVVQEALRRGWYLGEDTFRDRLLALMDKAQGIKTRVSRKADALEKDYSEKDAEQIIQRCGPEMGLPTGAKELCLLRKGDEGKALMAALIRGRTAASTEWIAKRLQMGHPGSVSRQVGIVKRDKKLRKKLNELEKMCHCGD